MKAAKLVQYLEEAIQKLGYRIRIEKGGFRGGKCILAEEKLVFINRRFGDEERAEILGRALAGVDYDSIYLPPEVREYVEQFVHRDRSVEN